MAPHSHAHSASSSNRLWLVFGLTATIFLAELAGGWISGSLALISDAVHMAADSAAIFLGAMAATLAKRPADQRRTYGYGRVEVIGAIANASLLIFASIFISIEAIGRITEEARTIDTPLMAIVAAIGLVANLIGLYILHGGQHTINSRAVLLHMVGDTLNSVAVLVGAGVIAFTGWYLVDPALSLIIAGVILTGALRLLKEGLDIILESAPRNIDSNKVRQRLEEIEGVASIHDLHIWTIGSGRASLSAHFELSCEDDDSYELIVTLTALLKEEFGIDHATLQPEPAGSHPFAEPCDHSNLNP
ncbi:cation transporter [Myxococcota bacterium]|nr:cation transporter [Myxococcota bacterium]